MMRAYLERLTAAVLLACVAAGAAAQDYDRSGWPDNFTIATASQGGTYYSYGSGWANFVGEELGLSGGAEVTGGPVQNLALVHTGEVAFGLATMGPAADALAGRSQLAPGIVMDNVCAMFPMYQTPFSVTALRGSGIERISEIPSGSSIGFGPAGSTSDTYFPEMMRTLGVDFERRNGSWSDLANQLQDGLVDVVAFAAGIPIPAVSQLEVQTDIRIIEFTPEEQERIVAAFPVSAFTIPASTYRTLKQDSRAVSMWNFSIAQCSLPDSLVYAVTKLTMENNQRMVSVHSAARATVPENVDKNQVLPFHPGAARWFNENGYPIPDELIK